MSTFSSAQMIYDFTKNASLRDWRIIDDGVMGGVSDGHFKIDDDGNGVFYGNVSTDNNGGFSSVRHQCSKIKTDTKSKIVIRLKGDGKEYQLRIKDKVNTYFSYIISFKTSGDWEEITISVADLYPSFRGRRLNLPNYAADSFEEIVFLIGNKRNETFKLTIDKIELR
jgi:NADH dehydrogenase [ubiquinone] 1 alpha subcomplex assembly factor 1